MMNNKYIKKSVEIEAIQWNGNNLEEIMEFLSSEFSYDKNTEYVTKKFSYHQTTNNLYINTLEGEMKANIGDYIIKGIKGEYYPCKPDIFELTYEKDYTLEECKKMWEEDGFNVEVTNRFIYIDRLESNNNFIFDRLELRCHSHSGWINIELNNLITKTLKTLEKEKEDVCS